MLHCVLLFGKSVVLWGTPIRILPGTFTTLLSPHNATRKFQNGVVIETRLWQAGEGG